MKDISYRLVVTLSWIFLVAGLLTLVPWSTVGTLNMLGYRSVCPAAPTSTILLLAGAAALYLWAAHGLRRKRIP